MTDARARVEAARQRDEIAAVNQLMDEVDAEFPTAAPVEEPAPEEPEASAKDISNSIRINGRTGGHAPQIKKAARYIDASAR